MQSVEIPASSASRNPLGSKFTAEMGLLLKMCKCLDPRRDAVFQARLGLVEGVVRHVDAGSPQDGRQDSAIALRNIKSSERAP